MSNPKVSIIIRTCGRPNILKNALNSIKNQVFMDYEVIIVEDGDNISEEYLRNHFKELNYVYFSTGNKVGRCKVGNIGLEFAKGSYINFLDDDDIFLPNHLEILVDNLERDNNLAAYSIAEEHQINIKNNKVKRKLIRYKQPYNKLLLCYLNYIPIQCIMFKRQLYDKLGGFDINFDVLEDWDLWVRYSTICNFTFIPVVTSIYYTPYKSKVKRKREREIKLAAENVIEKHKEYKISMNVKDLNKEVEYLIQTYNKKNIIFYMQKIRNYLLYKDI